MRDVLCGCVPGAKNFGKSEPQMHISKEGGPLSKDTAGASRALHSGSLRRRQRSAALGTEASRAGRKECRETSRRCRSAEVGRTAAQAMGPCRGLRTIAEQPQSGKRRSLECDPNSRAQPPKSSDCAELLAQLPSTRQEARSIIRSQHRLNWVRQPCSERKIAHNRLRMEGWRQRRLGSKAKTPQK